MLRRIVFILTPVVVRVGESVTFHEAILAQEIISTDITFLYYINYSTLIMAVSCTRLGRPTYVGKERGRNVGCLNLVVDSKKLNS